MTRSGVRHSLWVIAAIFAVAGGILLMLPTPNAGIVEPLIPGDVAAAGDPTTHDATLAEEIVVANLFSARRSPPTTRYQPSGDGVDSSGALAGERSTSGGGAVSMEQGGDAAERVGPALYGTVVGVAGAPSRALLQLDLSESGPRMYAEGEGEGGYRVLSIAPRMVVLRGPRGRVTLRLDPQEHRP